MPTCNKSNLSVNSLCTFNSPNALKRLPDIVDLNHVFKRLAVENERSSVKDV